MTSDPDPVDASPDPTVPDAVEEGPASEAVEAIAADEPDDPAPPPSEFEALFDDDEPERPLLPRRRHHVTAVIVAHDGAVWLPAVLTTLAAQSRHPDAAVGVDAGSADATADLLRESLGPDRVVTVPADAGFGAAAAAGLEHLGVLTSDPEPLPPPAPAEVEPEPEVDRYAFADPARHGFTSVLEAEQALDPHAPPEAPADAEVVRWVWLLHDDSAPDPSCLAALLDTADDNPSATVLGPKVRGWHDRRLLLEVGVTVSGSGRRETGLERREHDQGQHDGVRDVLAVGSAGMLVRREVWTALDGFDPALPLFRDDLDFCWRAHRAGERVMVATDAVLHHREAGYHGRRDLTAGPPRPHRSDREAALHVLLAHTPSWRLPFTTIRLVVASLLRVLGYLVGKDPGDALDELAAVGSVLAHPGRLAASRRRIAATSTLPSSVVRHLRPRPGHQARHALEVAAGVVTSGRGTGGVAGPGSALGAVETGPVDDDAMFLDDSAPGPLRRLLVRPGVLLVLGLLVLTGIAARGLWFGEGTLLGGALLPAPDGAGDLWRTYTEAWHDVGPGSATPAPPYLAALAALATLLLGKAPLAVSVVVLLAVPLAGVSLYLALRGVVASTPVKVWAAATYALLPAVTGAVAGGHLGTAATAVLLPPTIRMLTRTAGLGQPGLAAPTWRTAWSTALLVSLVAAAAPALWVLAVLLGLVAGLTVARDGAARRRLAAAVLTPIAVLLPWSAWVAVNPALLLGEPGLVTAGLTDPDLSAIDVALLHPGGPGMSPLWLTAGVVAAAVLTPLRRDRLRLVLGCWLVALVALVLGVVQTVLAVTLPGQQEAQRTWPGPATLLLGLAFVAAVAVAADGLRRRLAGASFGWRQPVLGIVVVAALLAPLLAAGWWLPGAGDPLRRQPPTAVPAFVAADAAGPDRPRTLVLRRESGGRITYSLVDGSGPVLGDGDTGPPAEAWDRIDPLVAALASGRGGDEVVGLAAYAVRYVQLADPGEQSLVRTLDSEPGLRRLSSAGGEALWRVAGVTSRVRVVAADGAAAPVPANDPASGGPLVDATLSAGAAGRTLVLSEAADGGWRASADGGELTAAPAGAGADWAQAFDLPAGAPQVQAWFDGSGRTRWLWLQLALLVVVVVLALPARREEDPDPGEDDPAGAP